MSEGRMADTGPAEPHQRPGELSVISTTTNGICVLAPAGEIDYHTMDRFQQALEAASIALARIVVDLSRVSFMDSSGINMLITAHHDTSEAGGWLRLAAPTAPVLRTLQVVGVDQVIDCHATLCQALGG
ncbi:STAS domain-containing protein [Streptomyces sp. YS-3]|uniref:STAS domain-containing protein n=1 Tax=Streptomyces sp. YS-3 TaxID=3381352 RepID=UPI0038627EEA